MNNIKRKIAILSAAALCFASITVAVAVQADSTAGKTENQLSYNAKNEVVSGTYAEPEPADPENYYFAGWSTDKNAKKPDSNISLTPNDVTNEYLNRIADGADVTLYAVYLEKPYVYYAVSVWGIGTDTVSNDDGKTTQTGGLTFGPATGNMFSDYTNYGDSNYNNWNSVSGKYAPMLNAHKISDSTYLINDDSVSSSKTATGVETDGNGAIVATGTTIPGGRTTVTKEMQQADMEAVQKESEAALTENGTNAIVGDDAGTDDAGNTYRCIHYDNWATILYWNDKDPHVYDKCVENHCSKRLAVRGSGTYMYSWFEAGTDTSYYKYDGTKSMENVRGDGASAIGQMFWDLAYDNSVDADDMYSASYARGCLVGGDRLINPNDAYINGTNRFGYSRSGVNDWHVPEDEAHSLLYALPKNVREHIGAKQLYDTVYQTRNTKNTADAYYDKLWLFDSNEIFNSGTKASPRTNSAGSSVYSDRGANSNGSRGSLGWWWLRSRDNYLNGYGVGGGGYGSDYGVSYSDAAAPGFTLLRR